MGNIVIVTHWLDGDVIPFIRIGKVLKERGHEVTLITHCYFETMAREASLEFEAWDTPEQYAQMVEDMSQTEVRDNEHLEDTFETNLFHKKYENNEIRIKECLKILKYCDRENTVILCKNRSSVAAYIAAEKRNLPLASVLMNPTEILSMLVYEKIFGDKEVPQLNELRSIMGLKPITSWLQWESSAKMTLALWPEWYDVMENKWPTDITPVGFPLEDGRETRKCEIPAAFEAWLDKHPKPIIITGGTTKLLDEQFYPASIAACGRLGRPTVVVTRYQEMLPKKLPENVVWYKYLPLDEILPKMGLIIHHGGMGTLSGAMKAGVPQLILPYYVDRPYNATLIKGLGVGDFLYRVNWQVDKIVDKMNLLLEKKQPELYLEYSMKMKQNKGVTEAANQVERLLEDKKYCYELREPWIRQQKDSTEQANCERRRKEVLKSLSESQRRQLILRMKSKGE